MDLLLNSSFKKKVDFFKLSENQSLANLSKKLKEGQAIAIYTGSYILDINNIDTVCYEENCQLKNKKLNILKSRLRVLI